MKSAPNSWTAGTVPIVVEVDNAAETVVAEARLWVVEDESGGDDNEVVDSSSRTTGG